MPLLLLLLCCCSLSAVEGEAIVLLTGFGPFAGRGVNGSQTVVESLDGHELGGVRIVVTVLPVRWGEPERQLPPLVERWQPRLLLCLGEGRPGVVAVEGLGHNRAAHPDEAGVSAPADLGPGPASRASRLRFDPAWFSDSSVPVVTSQDAGSYLCNATFYHALALPVDRVGFVHLPPQGATPDAAYQALCTPIIRRLIAENLSAEGAAASP
jgi:pyroglutamyl-peptidase